MYTYKQSIVYRVASVGAVSFRLQLSEHIRSAILLIKNKMYCVVELSVCKTVLIVKRKHCKFFYKPKADMINRGVRFPIPSQVFYSPQKETPKFDMPIREAPFDVCEKALYEGRILDHSGWCRLKFFCGEKTIG